MLKPKIIPLEFQDTNFKVQVLASRSEKKARPSLLILPPTGGVNILDRFYARYFAHHGFDTYILDRWTGDDEYTIELRVHTLFYQRAQKAISLVLNHIEAPFIGILGTSVGGLHTAISMGLEDRLDAAFVITAGVPIAEVTALTDQELWARARLERFQIYKYKDSDEYIKALTASLPFEPLHLPRRFEGKSLGMSIATKDTKVPTQNQYELKKLWQPESVLELPHNHFFGILRTWLVHSRDILRFFQQSLEKKLSGRS